MQLKRLGYSLLADWRHFRRPLLIFHFYFALLSLALIGPTSAWLLNALLRQSGSGWVSNTDLLQFALSPWGLLWLLCSASLAALLLFIQHAGSLLLCLQPWPEANAHPWRSSLQALMQLARQLPRLLGLACSLVGVHLLCALVWLLALLGLYRYFLGQYDLYYVVQFGPDESLTFVVLASLVLLAALAWHSQLYLRWLLALPASLIEQLGPWQAMRRSRQLSQRAKLKLLSAVLSLALLLAALPIINGSLFGQLGGLAFRWLGSHEASLMLVLAGLLLAYLLVNLLLVMFSVSLNGLLLNKLYRLRAGQPEAKPLQQAHAAPKLWAAGLVEASLVVLAVGQLWLLWPAPPPEPEIQIIAHRGNAWDAPENTMPAIELAIAQGSHYIELDVRATLDQQLVILHDRDLLRIAGEPRSVWQLTLAEIQALDAGRWFGHQFTGTRVPTLAQALASIQGRAQLYLEIKPAPQSPELVPLVVAELQRLDAIESTIVASLDPEVIRQTQALAPELRTSLLVHTALGPDPGLDLYALAYRDSLVTPLLLAQRHAQGQQVHVWTLNDAARMAAFIDLGVDGIITDRPDLLAQVLAERAALSPSQRQLMRLRFWLGH